MAAAVNEKTDREGASEYVKVLGIDSRPEDVANTLPTDASSLVLEGRHDSWEEERKRLPYLSESHELPPLGGAARQRPIGRYFLDNPEELERTSQFLESHIEEFVTELNTSVTDSPVTKLNVWVVNSLAGGTGSGVFPLVAGLIDAVLVKLEAERGIETTLRGLGSLLRLDRLAAQDFKPPNPPSHYLNTYTALSELQPLLNDDSASISLNTDSSQFVDKELTVGGVFDQYVLVGTRGREQSHLNSMNRVTADTIYYFGVVTSPYNGNFYFPQNRWYQGPASLLSLDATEITFPIETAEEYVELTEEIAKINEERGRLERAREETVDDLHYLDTLLSLDHDGLPSSKSPIPRALVKRCYNDTTDIIGDASPERLDTHVDDVADTVENDFKVAEDRDFNSSAVVRYLLLSRLIPTVEQKRTRARDELSNLVTTLFDAHRNTLQRRFDEDSLSTFKSNPVTAAEEIAQFLNDERDRLVEEREESLPIVGNFFRGLEARTQEVEQSLNELSTRLSAYEHYMALSNSVHDGFEESRDTLSTLRMEIERARYELDDEIDECTHEIKGMQMHRERLATELNKPTPSQHRTLIPVERPEGLNSGILEQVRKDGLTALVEANLVERDVIEQAIEQSCQNLNEPIQDRPMVPSSFSVLAPVLAEENTEEWWNDIDSAAVSSGFDTTERQVDTTDSLSLSFRAVR